MELNANSKEVERILNDVRRVAGLLFYKGWSERNAGNISIRIKGDFKLEKFDRLTQTHLNETYSEIANMCFFITGLGTRMQDIAEAPSNNGLLIQINHKGDGYYHKPLSKSELIPSSELPTHLSIHNMITKRGSGELVIMHTHVTELIALTHNPQINNTRTLNNTLWSMHPETIVFLPKGLAYIPYTLPGTIEIADATVKGLMDHDMVMWEKHGVFAIGKSIIDTFDSIDIASKAAKIYLECKAAGFEPEGFTTKQLSELKNLSSKFSS